MTQNEIDIVAVLQELASQKGLGDKSTAALKRLLTQAVSHSPEALAAAEDKRLWEQRMKELREKALALPEPRPGLTQHMIDCGMVRPPPSEDEIAQQQEYKRKEEERKQQQSRPSVPPRKVVV